MRFVHSADYWIPARANPLEAGSLGRDDDPMQWRQSRQLVPPEPLPVSLDDGQEGVLLQDGAGAGAGAGAGLGAAGFRGAAFFGAAFFAAAFFGAAFFAARFAFFAGAAFFAFFLVFDFAFFAFFAI
jgi:hypothetical protein